MSQDGNQAVSPGTPGPPGSEEGPVLEVTNLRTEFATPAGPLVAVDGVSFSLDRGKALGIVASRGRARASPPARCAAAAQIERGLRGEVLLNGIDVMAMSDDDLREIWGPEVAMVFQDPLGSLNPVMRIGQQVAEGLRVHHGVSKREARDTALTLLRQVGIPSPESRDRRLPPPAVRGMRQRVVIAIALACGRSC